MAITSTYPIIVPKLTDLIVGTQTYTAADPVLNNPTRNFTVQSIADLVSSPGTANTIAMFSTSGLTDSLITQAGSSITVAGDIVASKFIDVLDPAFYLQPKLWSYINHLNIFSTIGQMIDPGVQGWQLTSDSSLTTLRTDTAAFRIFGGRGSGEIIRFENDTGRVGIGITNPSAKLHVVGEALINGNLYFGDNTTTDPRIFNYANSLHLYAAAGNQIDLGGGIGSRQNNVSVGNGSLYVSSGLKLGNISEYADNAAALTAGLVVGEVYRTVDLLKIVH
mgnify:FL=1